MKSVIIIAGYAASGKTTLARRLARNLDFAFIDLGSIVRQATIDYLKRQDYQSEEGFSRGLANEVSLQNYVNRLVLTAKITDGRILTIKINGETLNIDDPTLREGFLDDKTLLMGKTIRPKLAPLQRAVAELTPVVFSARNEGAFSLEESVRIFIDPGMTKRVRRRAFFEGTDYSNLDHPKRRDLLNRVVDKERKNIELGVALPKDEVTRKGFTLFENSMGIKESLEELTALAKNLLRERELSNKEGGFISGRRLESSE